eukprot:2945672-Lingulodinium_polyedra.AAC.1
MFLGVRGLLAGHWLPDFCKSECYCTIALAGTERPVHICSIDGQTRACVERGGRGRRVLFWLFGWPRST